jgi:phage shock protein PspC (stress-responsive transcriptional regulator)
MDAGDLRRRPDERDGTMTRAYRETSPGLYRSRDGLLFGVCKGLAEYFNLSVFWTRVVAVIILLCTGLWPVVGVYLLAALLMKRAPMWY